MSQSSREARRERIAEWVFNQVGLEWSDDDELRQASWLVAIEGIFDSGLIGSTALQSLKAAGLSLLSQPQLAVGAIVQLGQNKREIFDLFQELWNRSILQGPEADEPEPARFQVPLDKAAELPEQVKAMIRAGESAKADEPTMPAWLIPAAGLAAFYLITRK
jgi:hypothetical protein